MISFETPNAAATARTSDFNKSAIGLISTPPSPLKNSKVSLNQLLQ
jgi:hypothetical protein